MRKFFAFLGIFLMLISNTAFAGDIPESLLMSDDAHIFFGEVIYYHPNKEIPTVQVSPVKVIKGDLVEGSFQTYLKANPVGDFKPKQDEIYLFTYYDDANTTDIFEVTSYDTSTLKLKHVEGDMWERFEKYLNDGEYGVAKIEGRNPSSKITFPAIVLTILLCISGILGKMIFINRRL